MVNYGEQLNKIVVIVDIMDENRVLVDFPSHASLKRPFVLLNHLALTSIKLDRVAREAPVDEVKKECEDSKAGETLAAPGWGNKLAKMGKRGKLDDFGRLKVMAAKMKNSKVINAEF